MYGEDLWRTILREQLQVTEEQFWTCVSAGTRPDRSLITQQEPVGQSIPANVVQALRVNGVSDSEIAALGRDGAIKRAQEIWSGM